MPKYWRTKAECSLMASPMEQKMTPFSFSFSLKVVFTDTESMMASTAVPLSANRSSNGMPSLSNVFSSSGSNSLLAGFFAIGSA